MSSYQTQLSPEEKSNGDYFIKHHGDFGHLFGCFQRQDIRNSEILLEMTLALLTCVSYVDVASLGNTTLKSQVPHTIKTERDIFTLKGSAFGTIALHQILDYNGFIPC